MPTLLRSTELVAQLGIPATKLYYYRNLGLLPYWRADTGGHRRYELDAVRKRLQIIDKLKDDGLTIQGVVAHFKAKGLIVTEPAKPRGN